MKRFTKRIDEHVYFTMGKYPETLSVECTSQDVRQILKHLANYEDLNLTPEEISSLITTIESQKEEIEKLNNTVNFKNHVIASLENDREIKNKRESDLLVGTIDKDVLIESLKAITELAVKGLNQFMVIRDWQVDDPVILMIQQARSTLSEIERLSK